MKIALDYDKTFTADPGLWRTFAHFAKQFGHEVRIVSARHQVKDNIDAKVHPIEVIYCDGVAKQWFCHHVAEWEPDIWIDDKPKNIYENGPLTRQQLEEWRKSPEYNA